MRTHAFTLVLSYIYGLVALLDNTQSSFSSITISTNASIVLINTFATASPLLLVLARCILLSPWAAAVFMQSRSDGDGGNGSGLVSVVVVMVVVSLAW